MVKKSLKFKQNKSLILAISLCLLLSVLLLYPPSSMFSIQSSEGCTAEFVAIDIAGKKDYVYPEISASGFNIDPDDPYYHYPNLKGSISPTGGSFTGETFDYKKVDKEYNKEYPTQGYGIHYEEGKKYVAEVWKFKFTVGLDIDSSTGFGFPIDLFEVGQYATDTEIWIRLTSRVWDYTSGSEEAWIGIITVYTSDYEENSGEDIDGTLYEISVTPHGSGASFELYDSVNGKEISGSNVNNIQSDHPSNPASFMKSNGYIKIDVSRMGSKYNILRDPNYVDPCVTWDIVVKVILVNKFSYIDQEQYDLSLPPPTSGDIVEEPELPDISDLWSFPNLSDLIATNFMSIFTICIVAFVLIVISRNLRRKK